MVEKILEIKVFINLQLLLENINNSEKEYHFLNL